MLNQQTSIISGAESFYLQGSKEVGILLSHGFNGTPQSMEELGELFNSKGYTVSAPRLPAHGTHEDDLLTVSYREWIEEIKTAFNQLKRECTNVFIVGQSMGGTLALFLGSEIKNVSGIITINAAIKVPFYQQYKYKTSPLFIAEGKPDIKDESVFEIAYENVSLHAIKQLLSLIDRTKEQLANVTCPLILLKSKIDNVVPPKSTDYIFNKVNSSYKKVISLDNSYHVASMDFDKEKIVKVTSNFICDVMGSQFSIN